MRVSSKILVFIIGWLGISLLGCKQEMSIQEFISYANENSEWIENYQDETYLMKVTYKPSELMTLVELRAQLEQNNLTRKQFEKTLANYRDGLYFNVKIGLQNGEYLLREGVKNKVAFAQKLDYFINRIGNDFYALTEQGDTIRNILCNYQRTFGAAPDAVFTLVFSKRQIEQYDVKIIKIIYNDRVLNIYQSLVFEFEKKTLFDIPKLKFEKNEA